MTDRYQKAASMIMYEAMLLLRAINPGPYNGFWQSSLVEPYLPAISGAIGDGFHNIPELLVKDMPESERGDAIKEELSIFMTTIKAIDLPTEMPHPWHRFIGNIQDIISA